MQKYLKQSPCAPAACLGETEARKDNYETMWQALSQAIKEALGIGPET